MRRHLAFLVLAVAAVIGPVLLTLEISKVFTRATDRATLVEVGRFEAPTALLARPDTQELLLAERAGKLYAVKTALDGSFLSSAQVLDISDQVTAEHEGGMVGLAVSPTADELYISYTDKAYSLRIVSFRLENSRPLVNTERLLLTVPQPFKNHNGGHLLVDSNGYLMIGLGDGGYGGYPDPDDHGRNQATLLGSLLRIIPTPGQDDAYAIPVGNPFYGGDPTESRPEILAFGLRNPWRFDLDPTTGDLWVADVGQGDVEEINFLAREDIESGVDFGWAAMEGSVVFRGPDPAGDVLPAYEYFRVNEGFDSRCAVIGGVVVRGTRLPDLAGAYLFSDFCDGMVRALRPDGESNWKVQDLGATLSAPTSFARSNDGTVYVLSLAGGVYRLDLK
ncbi:MAG: sugar dehydrogenase [Acidobacteria bacterium]|jgi:glucose/arabinose dehydrogenase|nr:sugar dehydrogenase [Acidobacteriota bacterium]|tara:strand:- start:1024 stop:2199 length:1176 start_codon:yes stop_codon:yes gene_type:complete